VTAPIVYVAIDLEMTGLDADRDAIIEIAAVRFDERQELGTFRSLVRCRSELSLHVRQLTGIDPADLMSAPPLEQALAGLRELVRPGDVVVAHNLPHDLRFLRRSGVELNLDLDGDRPGIDTYELATVLLPDAQRYALSALLETLDIQPPTAHRALSDAASHRDLFLALLDRARRLPPALLAKVAFIAKHSGWELAWFFEHALATPVAVGAMAEPPASAPAAPGATPLRSRSERADVAVEDLEALIAAGGGLSRRIEGFEDRPGQRQMLRTVADTFNVGDHVLIEAGTGTGKSLAYLLPAAAWAVANDRPVVVSTHTRTLQEQLVVSDLPLVGSLLGGKLRYSVLKGRANYLCLSRFERFAGRADLSRDEARLAAKVLIWRLTTKTGDRSELRLSRSEGAAWHSIGAGGDACTRGRCRFAAARSCYVQRARARAAASHVVVVNHALLVSDAAMRFDDRGAPPVLPDFGHLVVDEAHHMEDVATDVLGDSIGAQDILDIIESLAGTSRASLPVRARQRLERGHATPEQRAAVLACEGALHGVGATAREGVEKLFHALRHALAEAPPDGRDQRLTDAVRHRPEWLAVEVAWEDLSVALTALVAAGHKLLDVLANMDEPSRPATGGSGGSGGQAVDQMEADVSAWDRLLADIGATAMLAETMALRLQRIIDGPGPDDVAWIGRPPNAGIALGRAPLHVGRSLATQLFADKDALVLTSATLRAPDFDHVRERLGVPDAAGVVVPSPFDYQQQTLLYLPTDAPEPGRSDHDGAVARSLVALCRATAGRTLVLFTSHGSLRKVYHAVRGPLAAAGISAIAQGLDGSRTNLLDTFRDPEHPTVLLGTRSFWEGVDVPGDALSVLVIARLPFDVPSDPVVAARAETFEDPFHDYSIPQALLRFRQGFGRLIRSRSDRGVVVILDGRVHSRRYGELFLEALPACARASGPLSSLPGVAAGFLAGRPVEDELPPFEIDWPGTR